MAKEILDIVNIFNQVTGQATREEIYSKKYIHRIVHVIIRNKRGDFLMQLRSEQAKYLPLHWSTSVGGHVQTGEDFETAARREMQEEIGVSDVPLFLLGEFLYEADGLQKFLGVFEAIIEDGFQLDPEEVADVKFMNYDEFTSLLDTKIHPELLYLWNMFYKK